MLKQLSIEQFALIDNAIIEPGNGLNVLTGETGAGKTILVGALGILRGNRAQTEYIRKGEDQASVQGFFEFDKRLPSFEDTSGALPIDPSEGIMLRRDITRVGKNKCYINGAMVPLTLYSLVAGRLLDIHGQNQEQALLKPEHQLEMVDRYGEESIGRIRTDVARCHARVKALERDIHSLEELVQGAERELDFLSFQADEIAKAALTPGEDDELREEAKRLSATEEITRCLRAAHEFLQDGDKALEHIDAARRSLARISEYDETYRQGEALLEECYYNLEELARDLSSGLERVESDPDRLDEVETRLGEIRFLQKKYGTSIEEILAFEAKVRADIERYENRDEELRRLQDELERAREEYEQAAHSLRDKRKEAAKSLSGRINELIRSLSLNDASVVIEVEPAEPSERGMDRIVFLFAPNVGEGARELAKIASGGELSRIMLAIETILAQADEIDILVFDEVDSGIGGEALLSVAATMSRLAGTKQVFCVTHAPQLASFADEHFRIAKQVKDGRTITSVDRLDGSQRCAELTRMLGGKSMEGASEQAARMIASADRIKTEGRS